MNNIHEKKNIENTNMYSTALLSFPRVQTPEVFSFSFFSFRKSALLFMKGAAGPFVAFIYIYIYSSSSPEKLNASYRKNLFKEE